MGQVIVDPQELRRFAARLRVFSTEVLAQMQGVQRQLAALSATWRDQEQQKFAEEFDQTMKVLVKFLRVSEQHVPFLVRKAERPVIRVPRRSPATSASIRAGSCAATPRRSRSSIPRPMRCWRRFPV